MAYESPSVSGGCEGIVLEENTIIKKEEATYQYFDGTLDSEIPREDMLADRERVITLETACKCDICPKLFSSPSALAVHKRSHKNPGTRRKTTTCDICQKSFSCPTNLVNHRMIHTGEQPFQCDQCHKRFSRSRDLTVHKRIHSGERPYQCGMCDKSFNKSSDRTKHERIHTGEKPYLCDQCDKCFASSSALISHKRTHTREKPYMCDKCDNSFSSLRGLIGHKRMHSGEQPYHCEYCYQSFRHPSRLTIHKRTHTGEKPYPCDQCDKYFFRPWKLTVHKRIHTGERPCLCDQCPRSFIDPASLRIHVRKEHDGVFRCKLCDAKFATKREKKNHVMLHWDSCKCESSEFKPQEICVSKPTKCTKCEKYVFSVSPYKEVSQPNEGSSTNGLEPRQNSYEAIDSKSDQSAWMSSELKSADDVLEAVDAFLQNVKKEELDLNQD